MIPEWAWALLQPYVRKRLEARRAAPTPAAILDELGAIWPGLSVVLMVQEPWMSTIRFKRLARLQAGEMRPFLEAPEGYLAERFGGGKFKVNFHHGMHFVATKNFKPAGPPRWQDFPELEE